MNSINLHYLEEGCSRSKTLLFIHGTGGDSSDFDEQLKFFGSNCRSISIDLPGHGRSPEGDDEALSVKSLTNAVDEFAGNLGLNNAVVIGHSLGGLIALDLASRSCPWLHGIVLIDPPILFPKEVGEQISAYTERFRRDYREALQEFADKFLLPDEDFHKVLRARLRARLLAMDPRSFLAIWNSMPNFDTESALRKAAVPTLVILSTVPMDTQRLLRIRPNTLLANTFASGHYSQIEVPLQINGFVDTFITRFIYDQPEDQRQEKIETRGLPRKASA